MTVKSIKEAWKEADKLMPTDYEKDEEASKRAGHPIYRSTAEGHDDYISDLGDRLEVNTDNGDSVNIWIKEMEEPTAASPNFDDVRITLKRIDICDLLIACLTAQYTANDGGKKWERLHEKLKIMLQTYDNNREEVTT